MAQRGTYRRKDAETTGNELRSIERGAVEPLPQWLREVDRALGNYLAKQRRRIGPTGPPPRRIFVRRVVRYEGPSLACYLAQQIVARAVERGLAAYAPKLDTEGWERQLGGNCSNDA